MLTTPKEILIATTEKEDMEFKFSQSMVYKKSANKPAMATRDHLPFNKLRLQIALAMPDAPKKPSIRIVLNFE